MEPKKKNGFYEWAEIICGVIVLMAVVYTFLFRMVNVSGSSMETTLSNGEQLILSSAPYTPAYEDIVVVSRGMAQEPLIKRVIGLPGDTIYVDAESGEVYRNNELLVEPYIDFPTAVERMTGPVTVPSGQVFIMGDNRAPNHSYDSRSFGCVPVEDVVGKAVYRLMPFDRMGGIYDD
ncbi:MAG: signal peptidase I [Clostridia bacterium]|nr:signal peptidase I [Clostridia bacterium]